MDSLASLTADDPSWEQAFHITQKHLTITSQAAHLLRVTWNSPLDHREFMRMLGFSRMNLGCLIDAAELSGPDVKPSAALVEQSLQRLGLRLAAVVLAINTTCRSIIKARPPPLWKPFLHDLISRVEIGYRLGARVAELGIEGGTLMGFAQGAGLGIMLHYNQKSFKTWYTKGKGAPFPKEDFGCEPYQVTAFVLQQLGFGHEVAIGAALGSGKLRGTSDFSRRILMWKAALLWIEALWEQRNYPAEVEMRNFFPEIKPPADKSPRNPILEALYAEIAKLRTEGSKWTWHLPKPGYEATADQYGLNV